MNENSVKDAHPVPLEWTQSHDPSLWEKLYEDHRMEWKKEGTGAVSNHYFFNILIVIYSVDKIHNGD